MFNDVIVHDVGMRDGLQMEGRFIPIEHKIDLISFLLEAGIDIIQVGSFVNPKAVPQMKDADELFDLLKNSEIANRKTKLSALVLNEKGLERGLNSHADLICMGVSASETHSMKNTGMTTDEALSRIIPMATSVVQAGRKVQVSVQSAFGCGFEGKISEDKVFSIVEKYLAVGLKNISLADTSGHANPLQVERMFTRIFEMNKDAEPACHFHNTYGMGLTNIYAAIKTGVKYIETAFGGLGGCPFTKSPSGNVATEDFVHMLHQMNLRLDINIDKIIDASKNLSLLLERELPGHVYKTGILNNQENI